MIHSSSAISSQNFVNWRISGKTPDRSKNYVFEPAEISKAVP
jgi:hypothetical protein